MLQDPGIQRPADHQHEAGRDIQKRQRPHAGLALAGNYRDLAGAELFQRPGGRQVHHPARDEARLRHHLPEARFHHQRLRQAADGGLGRQHPLEGRWVMGEEDLRRPVQVGRHRQRIDADLVAMVVEPGAGGDERGFERAADPVAEPGLDAEVEEHRREGRDDQRRHHRHHAEQQHQPHMQPCARAAAPPFRPDPHDPRGEGGGEQHQHRRIGQHDRHHLPRRRGPMGRPAGQQHEGREPQQQRRDREAERHRPPQQQVGDTAARGSGRAHRASARGRRDMGAVCRVRRGKRNAPARRPPFPLKAARAPPAGPGRAASSAACCGSARAGPRP